jgi:hypothetical protein
VDDRDGVIQVADNDDLLSIKFVVNIGVMYHSGSCTDPRKASAVCWLGNCEQRVVRCWRGTCCALHGIKRTRCTLPATNVTMSGF